MRWLSFLALAACSRVTSRDDSDAGIDAPPVIRQDARVDAPPPPDAWVTRPCDAPPSFADGLSPTTVLHVEAGALPGGDGSVAKPFRSIEEAAAVATPGTFIQLGPGLHATNQFVADLRGTAQAPIWIGGVYGTFPRITGGSEGLHLTRPAYVVLQNLEIGGQSASAINIDDGVEHAGDSHHVAITGVYLHDVAGDVASTCVRASGIDDLSVHDSIIGRCFVGIDEVGVHRGVVARNLIYGTQLGGLRVRGGSTDVDLRQNRLRDAGSALVLGGSTPLALFRPAVSRSVPNAEARRVRAFDNAIYNDIAAAITFDGCIDCLAAHNLVYGYAQTLVSIRQSTQSQGNYAFEPTRDGRVINNAFVWSASFLGAQVDAAPFTEPSTFTFSHNAWFCYDVPSLSTPTLPVSEDGSLVLTYTGYVPDATTYCGGPEQGAAVPLPEIDGTIEGFCRTDSEYPTIGPQVYHGGCRI